MGHNQEESVPQAAPILLPLACRFIPHDQWLTTHIDPSWKVRQVKLWLLAKCLGISFESVMPQPSGSNTHATTQTPPPARYRPVSPITFAPDPRRRPISPILFAKGSTSKSKGPRTSTPVPGSTIDSRETAGDSDSGAQPENPNDDDELLPPDDGAGYEEDDEWDTADEGDDFGDLNVQDGPISLPTINPSDSISRSTASATAVMATTTSTTAPSASLKYNTNAATYTLLRFSTGQTLEDDFSVSWYDLTAFELLELHANLHVQPLPSSFAATAARTAAAAAMAINSISPHPHPQVTESTKHKRTASLYSLTAPVHPTPLELQLQLTHSAEHPEPNKDKDKDKTSASAYRVYFPPLNRTSLLTYILPYWEGYVRELRVVWREPEAPFANFANGYGYGYGGPDLGGMGVGGMGVGYVPPSAVGYNPMKRTTALEWRLRWVVIKEGVLSLCKDREDLTPVHTIPLTSLAALRGVEHLTKSPHFNSLQQNRGRLRHIPNTRPKSKPKKEKRKDKQRGKDKGKGKEQDTESTFSHTPTIVTSTAASTASTYSRYSTATSPPLSPISYASASDSETDFESTSELGPWAGVNAHGRRRRPRDSLLGTGMSFTTGSDGGGSSTGGFSRAKDNDEDSHPHGRKREGERETTLHRIGDEPVDGLKIVCVKFRSAERLKGRPPGGADVGASEKGDEKTGSKRYSTSIGHAGLAGIAGGDGLGIVSSRKGKEKEKEGGHGTVSATIATSAALKEKAKGRGKGLLPWERDGEKLKVKDKERRKLKAKVKSKDKGQGKEKSKERDWISAFGVRPKDKDRDKEKEKDRGGVVLGLGLGRAVGVQDAKYMVKGQQKEQMKSLQEEAYKHPRALLTTDVDGSPSSPGEESITFARVSALNSSSEDGGDIDEEGEDEGEYEAQSPDEEGHNVDGNKKEVPVGTLEDIDADSDSPLSFAATAPRAPPSSSSHTHPEYELLELGSDIDSGAGSSPVFAHTDDEELEWEQELGGIGKGRERDDYRRGYQFGHQYDGAQAARWGLNVGGQEQESVHEEEDRLMKEKANLERRKAKEREKREAERQAENEKTEWIVLDIGTDIAFSSFLRVLHRHLSPPTLSSFISSTPEFSTPPQSPTPTPTPTPFPSPISPRPTGANAHPFQWPAPSSSIPERGDLHEPTSCSSIRIPRKYIPQDKASLSPLSPLSPVSPSSQSDRFHHRTSRHPDVSTTLPLHSATKTPQSFGVLPYPEWRMEVAERAQRAGMGDVGRAMKWVLWQCGAELDLDLEEVRNRHASDEQASAEIRRKRRETVSLKNRRRSSASYASTITGFSGSSHNRTRPPTVYDSDVSEDTGRILAMSDSGEESSEAEWQGWMADLHRQHKAQIQQKRKQEAAAAKVIPETDDTLLEPKDPKGDRERRLALEPSAVVTTDYLAGVISPPGISTSAISTPSATLYSPSSSESLRRHQTRAFSFSPVDRSSSPTNPSSTQSHGHIQCHSASPLANHVRKYVLPPGSSLSHSTSMYATGLRSASSIAEQALRRPSMPILTADQTFLLTSGSKILPQTSILKSPAISSFPSQEPTHSGTHSPPFSPGVSSSFPVDEGSPQVASTSKHASTLSGPATVPRRASSAGLANSGVGGSLGRSPSVLNRGGGLLKKESADKMKEKEKEKRVREKEDKAKGKERAREMEREADEMHKPQRPKLSLSTTSADQHSLQPQLTSAQVKNVSRGKSILRRVKSSSSLTLGGEGPEQTVITTDVRNVAPHPTKKRKTALVHGVEMIVRGLDSAIDFVDGR